MRFVEGQLHPPDDPGSRVAADRRRHDCASHIADARFACGRLLALFGPHADDARAAVPKKYWGTFVGGWKTFQYGLKIEDSYWTEFDIRDGGTPIPSDYGGTYTISGNKITRFRGPPGGQPEDAFEWQVEGDQLVLTLLLDTDGPSYGVPDHVYMHLIYESHPFTRQG